MLSLAYAEMLFLSSNEQLEGLVDCENSLDMVPTASRVKLRASVHYLSQVYFYELLGGTTAQSIPNFVRPKDFHPTGNKRVWKLIGKTGDSGGGGGGGSGEVLSDNGNPEGVQVCTSGNCIYIQKDSVPPGSMFSYVGIAGGNTGWR